MSRIHAERLSIAPGLAGVANSDEAEQAFSAILDSAPLARDILAAMQVPVLAGPFEVLHALDPKMISNSSAVGYLCAPEGSGGGAYMGVVGRLIAQGPAWKFSAEVPVGDVLIHEVSHLLFDTLARSDIDDILDLVVQDANRLRDLIVQSYGLMAAQTPVEAARLEPFLSVIASPPQDDDVDIMAAVQDVRDRESWNTFEVQRSLGVVGGLMRVLDAVTGHVSETGHDPGTHPDLWRFAFVMANSNDAVAQFHISPPKDETAQRDFLYAIHSLENEVVAHFVEATLSAATHGYPVAAERVELARGTLLRGLERAQANRAAAMQALRDVAAMVQTLGDSPRLERLLSLRAVTDKLRGGPSVAFTAAERVLTTESRTIGHEIGGPLFDVYVAKYGMAGAAEVLGVVGNLVDRWFSLGRSPLPLSRDEVAEITGVLTQHPCLGFALDAARHRHCTLEGLWQNWNNSGAIGAKASGALDWLASSLGAGQAPSRREVVRMVNARCQSGAPDISPLEMAILSFGDQANPSGEGLLTPARAAVRVGKQAMLEAIRENRVNTLVQQIGNTEAVRMMLAHPDVEAVGREFSVRARGTLTRIARGLEVVDDHRAALERLVPRAADEAAEFVRETEMLENARSSNGNRTAEAATGERLVALKEAYKQARLMPPASRLVLSQVVWTMLSDTIVQAASQRIEVSSAHLGMAATLIDFIETELPPQPEAGQVSSSLAVLGWGAGDGLLDIGSAPTRRR